DAPRAEHAGQDVQQLALRRRDRDRRQAGRLARRQRLIERGVVQAEGLADVVVDGGPELLGHGRILVLRRYYAPSVIARLVRGDPARAGRAQRRKAKGRGSLRGLRRIPTLSGWAQQEKYMSNSTGCGCSCSRITSCIFSSM